MCEHTSLVEQVMNKLLQWCYCWVELCGVEKISLSQAANDAAS